MRKKEVCKIECRLLFLRIFRKRIDFPFEVEYNERKMKEYE